MGAFQFLLLVVVLGTCAILRTRSLAADPPETQVEPTANSVEELDANSDDDVREATLSVQVPPQLRPAEPVRPEAPTPAGATQRVAGRFGPGEAVRNLLAQ